MAIWGHWVGAKINTMQQDSLTPDANQMILSEGRGGLTSVGGYITETVPANLSAPKRPTLK